MKITLFLLKLTTCFAMEVLRTHLQDIRNEMLRDTAPHSSGGWEQVTAYLGQGCATQNAVFSMASQGGTCFAMGWSYYPRNPK